MSHRDPSVEAKTDARRIMIAAERNVERHIVELGEKVAWCMELEWIGLLAVRPLYRR